MSDLPRPGLVHFLSRLARHCRRQECRTERKIKQLAIAESRQRRIRRAKKLLCQSHTEEGLAHAIVTLTSLELSGQYEAELHRLDTLRESYESHLEQTDNEEEHVAYYVFGWLARELGCDRADLLGAAARNFSGRPDLALQVREVPADAVTQLFAIFTASPYLAERPDLAKVVGLASVSPTATSEQAKGKQTKKATQFAIADAAVIAYMIKHPNSVPTSQEIGDTVDINEKIIRKTPSWKRLQSGKPKTSGDSSYVGESDEALEEVVGTTDRGRRSQLLKQRS